MAKKMQCNGFYKHSFDENNRGRFSIFYWSPSVVWNPVKNHLWKPAGIPWGKRFGVIWPKHEPVALEKATAISWPGGGMQYDWMTEAMSQAWFLHQVRQCQTLPPSPFSLPPALNQPSSIPRGSRQGGAKSAGGGPWSVVLNTGMEIE